jgi:hypothetical protein
LTERHDTSTQIAAATRAIAKAGHSVGDIRPPFWPPYVPPPIDDTLRDIDAALEPDNVKHPTHYTAHPSGVECITITQHMNFCRGNAIKYIWRAGAKGNEIEDLRKAAEYIAIEINRLETTRSE